MSQQLDESDPAVHLANRLALSELDLARTKARVVALSRALQEKLDEIESLRKEDDGDEPEGSV